MEHSRRSARMSPDDVRDAIQLARDILADAADEIPPATERLTDLLVELGNIRRTQPRSPLTEEAARLEDRLHALI